MRKLLIPFLFLLLSGAVFAADSSGPMPYPIFGIITIEGDKINAMDVRIENVDTGSSVVKQVMQGELVMDLSEIGRADKVKVTYCIDDSRCNEFSNTYNVNGVSLNIGTDIESKPGGLSGPYSVYGHIYRDGTLLTNIEITLENLDKGYSKDIKVNEAGEYVFNLANWGVYDTGDRIRLNYGAYSSMGYVKGAGLELNLNMDTSGGGSNGGGSNDGGGSTTVPDDEKEEDQEEQDDTTEPDDQDTVPDGSEDVIDGPGLDISGGGIAIIIIGIIVVIGAIFWLVRREV